MNLQKPVIILDCILRFVQIVLLVFATACDIHLNPLNLGDSTRATSNPATPYLVTLPTPTPGK